MTNQFAVTADDQFVVDAFRKTLLSGSEDRSAGEAERWQALAHAGWLEILTDSDSHAPHLLLRYRSAFEALGEAFPTGPLTISIGLLGPLLVASGQPSLRRQFSEGCVFTAAREVTTPESGRSSISAHTVDGRLVLNGEAALVPWLDEAEQIVLLAEVTDGPPVLACVNRMAAGIETTHADTIDLDTSAGTIRLTNVECEQLSVTEDAIGIARGCYSLILDAQAVGSAAELVRRTVAYVNEREQFGQPIGSFQAVKHRVAEMVRLTETARSMLWLACSRFADSPIAPPWEDIDASRVCAGDAARRAAVEAIQCFGGMGFTWEQGLHRHYRRTLLANSLHGDVEAAARRLVRYGLLQASGSE